MLSKKEKSSLKLARAGIIASLYFVLTIAFFPISYGPIQVRISECLVVLPLFFSEAVLGLTIGCLIANLFGNGLLDILFGTLATLLAGLLTYFAGKKLKGVLKIVFGFLPPILLNAILVPFTFLAIFEIKELYFISSLQVLIGEGISVCLLGGIVYFSFCKLKKGLKRP